eukprot:jgi/Mesen1/8565/ME000493S07919
MLRLSSGKGGSERAGCVRDGVPEMAVCYHPNGVVQGYELLKMDAVLLAKGSGALHARAVQKNGAAVLRFLRHHCMCDPGSYWVRGRGGGEEQLHKDAGEDLLQLFELSAMTQRHWHHQHQQPLSGHGGNDWPSEGRGLLEKMAEGKREEEEQHKQAEKEREQKQEEKQKQEAEQEEEDEEQEDELLEEDEEREEDREEEEEGSRGLMLPLAVILYRLAQRLSHSQTLLLAKGAGERKMRQLIVLLGDSYLALWKAYFGQRQLGWALRAAELVCLLSGALHFTPAAAAAAAAPATGDEDAAASPLFKAGGNRPEAATIAAGAAATSSPNPYVLTTYGQDSFCGVLWVFVRNVYVDFQRSLEGGDHDGGGGGELVSQQGTPPGGGQLPRRPCRSRPPGHSRSQNGSGGGGSGGYGCGGGDQQGAAPDTCQRLDASGGVRPQEESVAEAARVRDHGTAPAAARAAAAAASVGMGPGTGAGKGKKEEGKGRSGSGEGRVDKADTAPSGGPSSRASTCFGRPMTLDWEMNLSAAAEYYAAAAVAFASLSASASGDNAATAMPVKAAGAAGGAQWEAAMRKCGRRAAAKRFTANLQVAEGGAAARPLFVDREERETLVGHARQPYAEALHSYHTARHELLRQGKGAEHAGRAVARGGDGARGAKSRGAKPSAAQPRYTRAGEKGGNGGGKQKSRVVRACEGAGESGGQAGHLSAQEAITKALALYESLGLARSQEAVFAHVQLAGHHRDRALQAADSWRSEGALYDLQKTRRRQHQHQHRHQQLQQRKYYALLAELHWLRTASFYSAHSHPDICVAILTERAALCQEVVPPHKALQLSEAGRQKLCKALCLLLKKFSGAFLAASKQQGRSAPAPAQRRGDGSSGGGGGGLPAGKRRDSNSSKSSGEEILLKKLRGMYKLSLACDDFVDVDQVMHRIWVSS